MKDSPKYIIEFNKRLILNYNNTLLNGNVIQKNPSIFKASSCYFNFDEDLIQFELSFNNTSTKEIKITSKSVTYYLTSSKIHYSLPIKRFEIGNGNCSTLKVHACFKNILLNLFFPQTKQFLFSIHYTIKKDENYITTFIATIPNIGVLTDYDPTLRTTPVYLPQDLCGTELVKLFKKDFKLYQVDEPAAKLLQAELFKYCELAIDEKFESDEFLNMFRIQTSIEDLQSTKEMEDYSLTFQRVYQYNECRASLQKEIDNHLKYIMCNEKKRSFINEVFVVEATKKMPNEIMDFDYIYITDMLDYQQNHDDLDELVNLRIVGKILYIFGNLILFKIPVRKRKEMRRNNLSIDSGRPYYVEFIPNRVCFRVTQRALCDAIDMNIQPYLEKFVTTNAPDLYGNFENFTWMNPMIDDNEEQQTCVRNIFNFSSFPSPYIIFGGPGTGKSSTIVETVAQIVKLKPKKHILITTNSNSACDDIGNRLLKYVSANKILRLYSPTFSQKQDKIDAKLQKVSNFRTIKLCKCKKRSCPETDGNLDDPSYEELYTARVVIVTLVSCGRLVSAGISKNHFDYIFIDEAASVSEPQALIPIVGLGISNGQVNAQIVLSGDHKQLGAIVHHPFSRKLGLEISLMERLMNNDEKYQRIDGEYDNDYVTQLRQNYRNHPAIMHFSNVHFYDSQLISMCSESIRSFGRDSNLLIYNPDFPILFHTTKCRSVEVGTSLKNDGELVILQYYLNVILKNGVNGNKVHQSDIGVISPYRGQRDLMNELLLSTMPKLEIGTVDAFQGREKQVILISCVRSGTSHVGFLRNEKRLNVALTRAKGLLIIIGNAQTLQKSAIWNMFITYCSENKAVVGDTASVNSGAIADPEAAEQEELPDDGVEDEYEDL